MIKSGSLRPILGRLPLVAVCVLIAAFPLLSGSLYYQNMIILSLVFAVGAVGLNIVAGYGGYVSLGHGAFLGLGAYAVAIITRYVDVSPLVWVPVAGLVTATFATLLGVIAMRARGAAFVMITVALSFLLQIVATNWDSFTGGSAGITPPLPTWDIAYQDWPFHFALVGVLAASLLMSWWIRRTKFGLGLLAIREDEDKAATIGVDPRKYKLLGFAASALFVGMAGGVYGYYLSFVDPIGMFGLLLSVQIIVSMLLGGTGTLWGPVLGAFIVEPVNEFANNSLGGGNARLLVYGGLLVVVVLLLPKGILPTLAELLERRRKRGTAGIIGARLEPMDSAAVTALRERSATASSGPLLELRGAAKRFGGLKVLEDCSFAVADGSITGLIGPNGSGKTTAFNLIDGTLSSDAGEVWFDGRRVDGMAPWSRAHLGLGRSFQLTRLFRDLTVQENVVAPLRGFSWKALAAGAVSGEEADRAQELLDLVGMGRYVHHRAGDLSYGQSKLVELAQILMLDPKLVLLDEPGAGINPTLLARMADIIRELNHRGMTFLIVEHNMPFVLGLCDTVCVLAQGACIAAGEPEAIQRDPSVLDAYLGHDYDAVEPVGGRA